MIKVTVFDNIDVMRSVYPSANDSTRIAWAQENENKCGYCVFSADGEILEINDSDNVSELLVRSALNYLDLRNVKRGICRSARLVPFLLALGFSEKDGTAEVFIPDFFKPCCSKNSKK